MASQAPLEFSAGVDSDARLTDILEENLKPAKYEDKDDSFLPINLIKTLITKEAIEKELKHNGDGDSDGDLIEWILNYAPRVFATTVQSLNKSSQLATAMRRFQRDGLNDLESTWKGTDYAKHSVLETLEFSHSGSKDCKRTYKDTFSGPVWSPSTRGDFSNKRWRYLAKVFGPEDYKYWLLRDSTLPVVWKSQPKEDVCVYRVEFHKDHWKHDDCAPDMVAIKNTSLTGIGKDEAERGWDREATALKDIRGLETPHILKCLAAVEQGGERLFLFPWADGGDLLDYWSESPRHSRRAGMILEVITQLHGLADALNQLHNIGCPEGREEEMGDESIRHGDIKPENILRFVDGTAKRANDGNGSSNELGLLKIADMGLAKRHKERTRYRNCVTSSNYGTLRYAGPEDAWERRSRPLSRLYDIWSMGCVIFDFVVWILYGNNGLEAFAARMKGTEGDRNAPYFTLRQTEEKVDDWEIHDEVNHWLEHMITQDPECSKDSAIKDLLLLVQGKLLVIDLPDRHIGQLDPHIRSRSTRQPNPENPRRATARDVWKGLEDILTKIKQANSDDDYLLTAPNLEDLQIVPPRQSADSSGKVADPEQRSGAGQAIISTEENYATPEYRWDFPVDNEFARQVIQTLETLETLDDLPPELLKPKAKVQKLCVECDHLIFWAGAFSLSDRLSNFKARVGTEDDNDYDSTRCDFCSMIVNVYSKFKRDGRQAKSEDDPVVELWREASILKIKDHLPKKPALSLIRGNEPDVGIIQIGLPRLPVIDNTVPPELTAFFRIVLLWLKDCDKHEGCKPNPKYKRQLPTRLIDVGTRDGDTICLYEITEKDQPDNFSYIALSHPWGKEEFDRFRTHDHADLAKFKREIPFGSLPRTFQDAIVTTRALEKRYLWIDSLCILQDDKSDKANEIPRMEDVYSSAYCVVAASRSEDQRTGFLLPRKPRDFIRFPKSGVYACEPIDDFHGHVLSGDLNKRAWVLQERALARRTVYFTETQTYFECGEGIRCETLGRIKNAETAFLGDPNFPDKSLKSTRGEQIRDFTGLFADYSRMELSHPYDRPNAIAGIESRLRRAYDLRGGAYGIFGDGGKKGAGFFHRSLLWRRAEGVGSLKSIDFKDFTVPPSWSWMCLAGGIDYLKPPDGEFEWQTEDLTATWTDNASIGAGFSGEASSQKPFITATLYCAVLYRAPESDRLLIYDTVGSDAQSQGCPKPVDCVVVARAKSGLDENCSYKDRQYILIVQPESNDGIKIYRRSGVGYVPDACIDREASSMKVTIY